jgi:RHS repeat-associated protein
MLGTTIVWNGGVHAYDGAGNMTKAGNAYFLYDPVSRIKNGLLYLGAGAAGATATFDHAYDGFGNLQSLTANSVVRNTPTAATTNRLTGSVTYDAAGNLTYWNGASYSYDRFGSMWRMVSGTEDWLYMYTADDERLWSFKVAGNTSRWTLRDLDGKVLREYQNLAGTWSVQRDYVYRGSQLLAAHTPDAAPKNLVQFHLDHLGTPRAVTNTNGARIAYHVYYPFGEEATSFSQDTERMKFTGHERDLGNLSSAADDLDYMHMRHFNAQTGRFLSVDPVGGTEFNPQTWNRYSYVLGNPLKYIDPEGLAEIDFCATSGSDEEKVRCQGSIEVVAPDPGRTFDPLTGVQGLGDLVSGTDFLQNPNSFNSLPHLPQSMHGMTFQQGLNFAVASGAGGNCASASNCVMIGEAATALENPLLQTIQGAQEVGLAFAFGGPAAASVGRTAAAQSQAAGRAAVRGLVGKGGLLNSNRYLRLGFGRHGGTRVFRIGGQWVKSVTGRAHIDLWKGGPL